MLPKGLNIKNNELYINKYSFKELQEKYGTPLYIYDKEEMLYNIETFNKYFKGENFTSQVVYASKAFLVPRMCEIISSYNWMIDAVSIGDLHIIKNSMDIEKAVFHGYINVSQAIYLVNEMKKQSNYEAIKKECMEYYNQHSEEIDEFIKKEYVF